MKKTVPRVSPGALEAARGELIGLHCRVTASPDAGIVGMEGHVVDETLKTLVLRRADAREVRLAKAACTFAFTPRGEGEPVLVEGRAIGFRPWDRGKKVR